MLPAACSARSRTGLIALVSLCACDPLVERPWVAVPTVAVVSPVEGSTLVQPGPGLTVEVVVSGCQRVQSLALRVRDTELSEAKPEAMEPGRFRFAVPVIRLLEQLPYGPSQAWPVDLQAHLVCGDFGQEARSDWRRISLSPFASLASSFRAPVYRLQAGTGADQVLALAEDSLTLFSPGGASHSGGGPSSHGLARIIGPDLYFWADCRDTVCWNRTGTLFHLDAEDLGVFATQKIDLTGDAVEIMAAPDAGRLVVAVSGRAFAPQLLFADLDLRNVQAVTIAADPVGPGRRLTDGKLLLLAFPSTGGSTTMQVVIVGPGMAVNQRPVPLALDARDALWAPSADGARAVVLDRGGSRLHRLLTVDGTLMPPIQLQSDAWLSLELDADRILLTSERSVRQLALEQGDELWRVSPDSGVEAAVALADGGCALLTGDLDLWRVDSGGKIVDRRGPLPNAWRLSSNLLATAAGWVHLGLGASVAGYRLQP